MENSNDFRTVCPRIPVYAVFYTEDIGETTIWTEPILWFESRLEETPNGWVFGPFQPVAFSPEPSDLADLANEAPNFLGMSLDKNPQVSDFMDAIAGYKKRKENSQQKFGRRE